jgi:putative ABC transport system substrate-binding protein
MRGKRGSGTSGLGQPRWSPRSFVNGVDSFINSPRFDLASEAEKRKLPVIYTDLEYVLAGGLMSLGPGHFERYYGAANTWIKVFTVQIPQTCPLQDQRNSL